MSFQSCLILMALFSWGNVWAGGHKPPCTFRIHVQTTGDNLSRNQAMPIILTDPPETIQVGTIPDLSERDLVRAEARETTNGRQLWVKFDNHGTTVLSAITTQSMGRIMVVYFNQKIIFAPVIDQQIGSGEMFIPYAISDDELKALVRVMNKSRK